MFRALSYIFVLVFSLSACSTNNTAFKPPLYVAGHSTIKEKQNLEVLIQETLSTINSANFKKNMLAQSVVYPKIFMSYDKSDIKTPSKYNTAAKIYLMMMQDAGYRLVKTPVGLVGSNSYYMGLAGVIGDGKSSSFSIGRGNLRNWTSSNSAQQSCAINTAAHEISHLITNDPNSFTEETQMIKDSGAGSNSGTNAVASYLIGTVAQCTWLENTGRISGNEAQVCVTVFGHRGFNGGRCTQFSNSQKIELRNDLFPPQIITD